MLRTIEYIVIHTSAANFPHDAADIRRWHVEERHWQDIGYHYVIVDHHPAHPAGVIQCGRPEHIQGAHALNLNHNSIGICCTGHGDLFPFTGAQMVSLAFLCASLCARYNLSAEHVIGHREIDHYGGDSHGKTCPGKKVDMNRVRHIVGRVMSGWDFYDTRGIVA